jgi:hypothetical protein
MAPLTVTLSTDDAMVRTTCASASAASNICV